MSTPAPIAPPAPPGLGRAGAARGGAPPGESSFATLLENDRARTAVAEGPSNEAQRRTSAEHRDEQSDVRLEHGAQPAAKADGQSEAAPKPEAQAEPQAPAVDPAMQSPAPPAPVEPVSTPVVASTTPFVDAVAEARAAVVAAVTAPATPAVPAAEGAAVPAAPAQPAVPAQPAAPAAGAVAQDGTVPAGEQAATQTETDAVPAPAAETEAPAEETQQLPGRSGEAAGRHGEQRPDSRPADKGGQGPVNANASDPDASANARAFETPARTGVTPARIAAAPAAAAEAAPAPAPTTTEPAVGAAPASEAAPASQPVPVRGATTLQHLARTVDAAMQLGHARGITRAKLHLHPAELGAIELHLRHTAGGLTARVVAESPEAVAVLQQAASDLRRSLEQAGITIAALDIGARADHQADERAFAGAFDGDHRGDDRGRGPGRQNGETADTDPVLQPIRARVPLPGGALVDVIA